MSLENYKSSVVEVGAAGLALVELPAVSPRSDFNTSLYRQVDHGTSGYIQQPNSKYIRGPDPVSYFLTQRLVISFITKRAHTEFIEICF